MTAQITSGLILLAIAFLLPGLIVAISMAFFMRRYTRFRSWIRITLILTVLGTGMWIFTTKYLGVSDIGSIQIGTMASVVAIFSATLSAMAVWIVPRKKLMPAPDTPPAADTRPIKTPRLDV
jgi:hypothetical protein